MCFAVYIGTNKILNLQKFDPERTSLYFEEVTHDEEIGLRQKFSKKNIYYAGSDSGCSCGFEYSKLDEDHKSAEKLISFLRGKTIDEEIEFYCCLEGDWTNDIESLKELDIRDIDLERNYFGLNEREFIRFKAQYA